MRVRLNELEQFAGNLLANIWMDGAKDRATLVVLQGDLGSGKTTFMAALCKRLGIKEPVQSPTYVLMKSYVLDGPVTSFGAPRRFNRVVHIDAYRLEKPEQWAQLKPEEFLSDPKALVFVEWPEKVAGQLRPDWAITFKDGHIENEREISIEQE